MVEIEGSHRCPLAFQMHNGVKVGVSHHALKRAVERGIDIEQRIASLKGIPLRKYKGRGVVAKWHKYTKHLKIITLW